MSTSTIALIIALISVVLYATEKLPIAVTSLLAMLAMVFTGVLTPGEAFAGFGNTTVILLIGLMIIGRSFFSTGLADAIGLRLAGMVGTNQKKVLVILSLSAAVMSMFVSPLAVVAVLFTIVDSISVKSNGTVTRKHSYLPLGIISTFAGQLTLIGTSSMLSASALLESSYYNRAIGMFDPTLLALGGFLLPVAFYLTVGLKVQEKWFDFSEMPFGTDSAVQVGQPKRLPKWKMAACCIVLLSVILGIILKVSNMGAIALLGALILMALGCIEEKEAYTGISWSTLFVVIGSLGIAEGLDKSGAGKVVADFVIKLAGPLTQIPFVMCAIFLVISVILSAFMSDTATVVICLPIALALCQSLNMNPLPMALVIARGANIAILTPISTASITITTVAGYRFKDYFRLGGIFCLGAMVTTLIALYFLYYV